jgi:hypothetical protein
MKKMLGILIVMCSLTVNAKLVEQVDANGITYNLYMKASGSKEQELWVICYPEKVLAVALVDFSALYLNDVGEVTHKIGSYGEVATSTWFVNPVGRNGLVTFEEATSMVIDMILESRRDQNIVLFKSVVDGETTNYRFNIKKHEDNLNKILWECTTPVEK